MAHEGVSQLVNNGRYILGNFYSSYRVSPMGYNEKL